MAAYSAVVLYYRAGPVLGTTLTALLGQSDPPLQVVVVDNASDDGVPLKLLDEFQDDRLTLLALDMNEGYAGGMNRGLAALSRPVEHVLFLTHETALLPTAAQHLGEAARLTGAAAVGPLLRRHRDDSVWSAGGVLDGRGATSHLTSPRSENGEPYEVDWLDGAAMFLDAIRLQEVGGFDERYFLYWEDVDVSTRLRSVAPIICAPRAEAYQETGSSPPYYAARNRILYWQTHGSPRAVRAAVLGECRSLLHDLARRRPRIKDAAGRLLGILDGARGAFRPRLAAVRTRPR